MFSPPYRAAVIGRTGRGDYGHGLDLALLGNAKLQLVAVADEDKDGCAAAAERLGVQHAYGDYRAMLEQEKPQFLAIAPRWLDGHKDMILACVERGVLGILCEKPLAPDLASCDEIVTACERSHVKLAMTFQTRYSPRYEGVKKLIGDGAIGELLELRGRGKEDRRGGGEDLMVLGVHVLDLCHDLLGEPAWCFARVTEQGRSVGPGQVRSGAEGIGPLAGDRIDALFGFQGTPVLAHFASSRPRDPGARFGLWICGSRGCIWMSTGWMPPAFLLDDPTWTSTGVKKWTPILGAGPGSAEPRLGNDLVTGNRAIVADLIHAVEADVQPRTHVRAGRTAVEMVLACYASHKLNRPVTLPLAERTKHPLA
jgi:predicted dehydrogenase